MKSIHQKSRNIIFIGLCFVFMGVVFVVSAGETDIGLKMRDNGQNVSLATCYTDCAATSPLKIRKNNRTYNVMLTAPNSCLATNLRLYRNGVIRAVKRHITPQDVSGAFQQEGASGSKTWLSSITCHCNRTNSNVTLRYNYPTDTCSFDSNGVYSGGTNGNPFILRCKIKEAIYYGGISVSVPSNMEGTFGRTKNGVEHIPSLTAICKIMGYDSYVSSTSPSDAYQGRSNYHSTGDNYLFYFR